MLLSLLPVFVTTVQLEFKLPFKVLLLARSVVEPVEVLLLVDEEMLLLVVLEDAFTIDKPVVVAFFGLRPGSRPGPKVPR